ncbi:MAG: hypothetical protein FJW39_27215 [Acidobacteria bacterium]|nr:hypothetical protein [Acidobacteriota bacterium]
MNCSNCGAAMRFDRADSAWNCEYCQSARAAAANLDGVAIGAEAAGAPCPLCRTPLHHATAARHRMLGCQQCHGLLIGMAEFLPVIRQLRLRKRSRADILDPVCPTELDREVRCPHCSKRMHTHRYGGPGNIVIDNCPACRVNWLDSGEISRVVAAPGCY